MKKILGLDLGTNSIGWALIEQNEEKNQGRILGMSSRIVPLGDDKGNFESGKKLTRNADRRIAKHSRRGTHRYKLRRNKLVYILHKLGMLPDFIRFGYGMKEENGNMKRINGELPSAQKLQSLFIQNVQRKGYGDDTNAEFLLELRKKALNEKVTLKELGRIFYLLNQRRGYAGGGDDSDIEKRNSENNDEKKETREFKKFRIEKPIVQIQKTEIFGKGESKKEVKVFKCKAEVTIISTGEIKTGVEGYCYETFEKGSEHEVKWVKKDKDDKYNYFNYPGEFKQKNKVNEFHEQVLIKIVSCEPAYEYFKKKWQYDIAVVDDAENSYEGKLGLSKTEQAKKFVPGQSIILEKITKLNEDGTEEEHRFQLPSSDWKRRMIEIEEEIKKKAKEKKENGEFDARGEGNYHVCHFFLDKIEENKKTEKKTIRGRVDKSYKNYRIKENIIQRHRYQKEFESIWKRQANCNEDFKKLLNNKKLLEELLAYIFPDAGEKKKSNSRQEQYRSEAMNKEDGLFHLIFQQVIYYQRDLKKQEWLIGECQYETGLEPDLNDDSTPDINLKRKKAINPVIARSHPLYQEFRLWKQINQISIAERIDTPMPQGMKRQKKYLERLLSKEQKLKLYDKLNEQKQLKFDGLLKTIELTQQGEKGNYKYYIRGYNKKYLIGNETLKTIKSLLGEEVFSKIFGIKLIPYSDEKFTRFWKLLFDRYGNETDENDERVMKIIDFLKSYLKMSGESEQEYEEQIKNLALKLADHKFQRIYGSLSEKAIRKLLPLMQPVHEGNQLPEEYAKKIRQIEKLYDKYKDRLNEDAKQLESDLNADWKITEQGEISKELLKGHVAEFKKLNEPLDKGGWQEWAAAQLMYGRHTAKAPDKIFNNYHEIKRLGKDETLRNPVVEQMVNETLQLVKSLWKYFGFKPDEIRVELARELKNNAEQRERMFKGMNKAEQANKECVYELMQMSYKRGDKTIIPENECLCDDCKNNGNSSSCYKKAKFSRIPSRNEILKYKLWKEQKFVSPYSGKPISISKLFDGSHYNKDHIIPEQRFFDDSNANKVIVEKTFNHPYKSNLTAMEFIKQYGGENGGEIEGVHIMSINEYREHVERAFENSRQKMKFLLMEEIPDDFLNRQIKETQYISRKVKEKLAEVVGIDKVTTTTGGITDYLREEWGLNDVFKDITKERYKRMALLARPLGDTPDDWVQKAEKEEAEKQSKQDRNHEKWRIPQWRKRHDHRHHAIDALIVACTSQGNVTQLNNLHQRVQEELMKQKDELKAKLKLKAAEEITEENVMELFAQLSEDARKQMFEGMKSMRKFDKPWKTFTADARKVIEQIAVAHKRKERILIQNKEDKNSGSRLEELILRVRGGLHLSRAYGSQQIRKKSKVSLEEAFTEPDRIVDEEIKRQIESRKSIYGDFKTFRKSLKNDPIIFLEMEEKKKSKSALSKIEVYSGDGNRETKRITFEELAVAENPNKLIEKIISDDIKKDISKFLEDKNNDKKKAFEEDIDEFNEQRISSRKMPVKGFRIWYAKDSDDEDETKLFPVKHKFTFDNEGKERDTYYETKDNYCVAILKNGNERILIPITFFDSVKWVTEHFNYDKKNKFKFPRRYDERLKYVEEIIQNEISKKNSGEILMLLQQDDLVYHPFLDDNGKPDVELKNFPTDSKTDDYKNFWFSENEVEYEIEDGETKRKIIKKYKRINRIYRVVKFSGNDCYFTPHNYASQIIYKPVKKDNNEEGDRNAQINPAGYKFALPKKGLEEYATWKNCCQFVFDENFIERLHLERRIKQLRKSNASKDEIDILKKKQKKYPQIKIQDSCIKIEVDRLGNIKPFSSEKKTSSGNVAEPAIGYSRTFSIKPNEELDEERRSIQANMTPEENLKALHQLRSITHEESELNKPLSPGTEIRFRKSDENS